MIEFRIPGRANVLAVGALLVLSVLPGGVSSVACAEEPLTYNRDIRPILAENCFACHGADSAARKAELRLDQREAAIDYGAITEGEPSESELIARIITDDPELIMPPAETKKTLTDEEKEKLARWVKQGAEYEPHWSFILPQKAELPAVEQGAWVKNPIDRFVLAQLEAIGLSAATEADPHTLFRRLHLDITGLPPSPEDVDKFASDYSQRRDAALSDWIDKLMQKPTWGEHRARYWLDAARYGDTHGLHFDNYREMWPYRDWVIRAFNANQPFDQFTVEQLAGDLLPNPTDDQLIATGFQRCNITTNEGGTIDEENLANYAVDRVQTLGWVYLGLTTNCSQCHDHKFDQFTMKDFYSLAAFFRNTTQQAKDGNVKDGRGPVMAVPSEEDKPRWTALPNEIAATVAERDERKQNANGDYEQWLASASADSYDDQDPTEGLLLQLPLDEGTGNEVSNRCDGPATFQATGDLSWIPDGKLGPAPVIKDGAIIDLGQQGDFEKDQPFSYGAWIKSARNDRYGGLIARADEGDKQRGWDVCQDRKVFTVHMIESWPESAIKVITHNELVKPDQWQHVFVTYDGSGKAAGIKIYVDGAEQVLTVQKDTLKPDANIRTSASLLIGQRFRRQVFNNGAIQDVRIYTRALNGDEVKRIAEVPVLQKLLAVEAESRTAEQQESLYDRYLNSIDPQYPVLAKAAVELQYERAAIEARSPVTHIQREKADVMPMAHILTRGEYDKPGDEVQAAPPEALHPLPEGAPGNRLGLAQWLVDTANPLTARVTVNRFWQELFGQGIVTTPEDFGVMGAQPSNQELLDWLAMEFHESGWNVRHLFKLMLTSAAYRQSSVITPEKLENDRDNSLLSRGPRFRMDAEMVRDYALSASGLLSSKMYGPGTRPYQPEGIWDIVGLPGGNTRDYVQDSGESLYRRTVYNFWKRMAPPANLEAFNAPSREVCSVNRERTNTPLQALVTLNDPQFVEAARTLANNALEASGDDDLQAIEFAIQRVLCRPPRAEEEAMLLESLKVLREFYRSQPDAANALISVGESAVAEGVDPSELAAWTMLCNQVLNVDEALNK